MILMNSMKVSIIGSSQDAIFFIKRSEFLKKDIKFSIFDSKEIQDNLKKTYNSVEIPWNISDEIIKELRDILKTYHYKSEEQHMSKDVATSLENLLGAVKGDLFN